MAKLGLTGPACLCRIPATTPKSSAHAPVTRRRSMSNPTVKAYDLSRYQRLVRVEGERVRGTFAVLLPTDDNRKVWVTSHDVTIYCDAGRTWGRVFNSKDLTGSVIGGRARLSKHMVAPDRLADAEDAWDELLAALVAAAECARAATKDHGVIPCECHDR